MSYDITGQENWDSAFFTDPQNSNSENYIYIVTAIAPSGENSQSLSENLSQLVDQMKDSEFIPDPKVDIYENPKKISEKGVISGSVITPKNTATFRDIGYILRVPAQNIIAASSGDLYINNCSARANIARFKGSKLPSPEEVTSYRGLEGHRQINEVVILGNTPHGKVEIVGVFYKTVAGKAKATDLEFKARRLASKIGDVPIIPIDEPQKKIEDSIDVGFSWDYLKEYKNIPSFFAINTDGIRYLIYIKEENGSYKLDLKKVDMDKKISTSADKSDIPRIQQGFTRLIEERINEEQYQGYYLMFQSIISNLQYLTDSNLDTKEEIRKMLFEANERMERFREQHNHKISTEQIGTRTIHTALSDKKVITETFQQWRNRMIESGVLQNDR